MRTQKLILKRKNTIYNVLFSGTGNFITWSSGQQICIYKKINILMSFMSDKRKVEMILKENAEELQDNEKDAVQTEQVVTKS